MQRYFFDLAQEAFPLDLQGIEFRSLAEGRVEALRFAHDIYRDRPDLPAPTGELYVEVTDSNRALLFTLVATRTVKHIVDDAAW